MKVLAGGVAIAAFAAATPASAQYYPGYGYGGGGIGQVINQVFGGGGYGYGYGQGNNQAAVGQCVNAVQQRLGGGYGYNGYGQPYGYGNNGYGYGQPYAYGNARVLGISRVEPRSGGGFTVRGVANSGRNAGYNYGYGYNGQSGQLPVDLTFKCKTDYRGFVTDVDIDQARGNYGYNNNYQPYSPYDYSQYGYRRY